MLFNWNVQEIVDSNVGGSLSLYERDYIIANLAMTYRWCVEVAVASDFCMELSGK